MAQVGIIMGSQSDLPVMKEAVEILEALGIDIVRGKELDQFTLAPVDA